MSLLSNSLVSRPRPAALPLTKDSAACALSFITSPSCPVRMRPPLPGMRVASMNRMSPPTVVHAVPQRPRHAVEHVRGGNKHDPRQVERHPEIIVAEGRVLLGIEHFEERRGGVALVAAAEFVDLVQHHHAIPAVGAADPLQDIA